MNLKKLLKMFEEMSPREADMQRRMAATRQAAAGVAPGTSQTTSGPAGTMTVTKSALPASTTPTDLAAQRQATPAPTAGGTLPTAGGPTPVVPQATTTAKPSSGSFAAMGKGSADFEESADDELDEIMQLSGQSVNEKAVSKQQQKFMGMVHAMQKGEEVKGASPELKKVAKTMSKKAAHDFAATKHKGLPKRVTEDVMLDEGGTTLRHIANRFKHEVKNFMNSGHMADALYDALYDYYLDSGEMPYGVAKAREGDPYQWVEERFYADMGSGMSETAPQHDTLSELARLAGLHESKLDECGDMDMSHEDNMNVSTNMSSDGTRNVTISAQGAKADELLSMLKLAGMHHAGLGQHEEPAMVLVSDDDEEAVEEERETQYANTPDEEYETVAAITHQGNDLNREKKQFANMPKAGDNPMATDEMLDEEMSALLDSILIRREEELDEGLFGDSDEELQARSPQYQQLKAMEPKYKGTEYEPQLKQRIDTARTRAEQGAGEVMQYDPKTGKQTPKPVVPPEQYKAK